MDKKTAVLLAKKIIELDILGDEIWEDFTEVAGKDAYELFRMIQNHMFLQEKKGCS